MSDPQSVPPVGSDSPTDPASVEGSTGQSGNRARDHLANERTYLAWLRTAIGVLALAAAIARLGSSPGAHEKVAVGITGLLGQREYFERTMKYDEAIDAKIAALTAEQVSAAFRKHIDPATMSYIKAGDFKKAGVYQ